MTIGTPAAGADRPATTGHARVEAALTPAERTETAALREEVRSLAVHLENARTLTTRRFSSTMGNGSAHKCLKR